MWGRKGVQKARMGSSTATNRLRSKSKTMVRLAGEAATKSPIVSGPAASSARPRMIVVRTRQLSARSGRGLLSVSRTTRWLDLQLDQFIRFRNDSRVQQVCQCRLAQDLVHGILHPVPQPSDRALDRRVMAGIFNAGKVVTESRIEQAAAQCCHDRREEG